MDDLMNELLRLTRAEKKASALLEGQADMIADLLRQAGEKDARIAQLEAQLGTNDKD